MRWRCEGWFEGPVRSWVQRRERHLGPERPEPRERDLSHPLTGPQEPRRHWHENHQPAADEERTSDQGDLGTHGPKRAPLRLEEVWIRKKQQLLRDAVQVDFWTGDPQVDSSGPRAKQLSQQITMVCFTYCFNLACKNSDVKLNKLSNKMLNHWVNKS